MVWDIRNSHDESDTLIWKGAVNSEEFHKIGLRWIKKYFSHPSYYKIDGKASYSDL